MVRGKQIMRVVVWPAWLLLVLVGCNRVQPPAPVQLSVPTVKVKSQSDFDVWEKPKHRFAVAGVQDPEDVRLFLAALQDAVGSKDRSKFAALIRYPIRTYDSSRVKHVYRTKAEFLRAFDRTVTVRVLSAIKDQSYDDLFCNSQGIMIGSGEIWFDGFDPSKADFKGTLKISVINGDLSIRKTISRR